jgi:hypothetical protein
VGCKNDDTSSEGSVVTEEVAENSNSSSDDNTTDADGKYVQGAEDDFQFCELDDGTLLIEKYTGDAEYLIIPDTIHGKKVSAVDGMQSSVLKGVQIPDTVKTICEDAFFSNESLEEVILGNGVETLEDEAFYLCRNLKSINLPDSITSIGECAFNVTSLTEIHIPTGISEIPDGTFCNGDWEELTIPGNVKTIGQEAFAGNKNLKKVTIEDGVEELSGHNIFNHCDNLTELHIPGSVTVFYDGLIVDSSANLTIYAPAGSAAETYAKENCINFVAE